MKILKIKCWLFTLILLFPSLGFSQSIDRHRFYVGVDRYSLDKNYLKWIESWNRGSIISELIYPFSGNVLNIYAGIDGLGMNDLFVRFETLAMKKFDTVIGTDTDFKNNEPKVWLLTEFKTKPNLNRTYIDFGYNFRDFWSKKSDDDIRIFATYFHYKSKFSMIEGVDKVLFWSSRNRPFPDLNSWYRTTWSAIGIGFHYVQHIRKPLFVEGKIRYFPKFSVKGKGYWNLRNLVFEHRGTDSEMFSIDFNLSVKPINFIVVTLGYNLEKMLSSGTLIYRIEDGVDTNIQKTVTLESQIESRVTLGIEFRVNRFE